MSGRDCDALTYTSRSHSCCCFLASPALADLKAQQEKNTGVLCNNHLYMAETKQQKFAAERLKSSCHDAHEPTPRPMNVCTRSRRE